MLDELSCSIRSPAQESPDDGSEYDDGPYDTPSPTPQPKGRNVDGRPAGKPPKFCYSDMIGKYYKIKERRS